MSMAATFPINDRGEARGQITTTLVPIFTRP
jgi:hypothetical protein